MCFRSGPSWGVEQIHVDKVENRIHCNMLGKISLETDRRMNLSWLTSLLNGYEWSIPDTPTVSLIETRPYQVPSRVSSKHQKVGTVGTTGGSQAQIHLSRLNASNLSHRHLPYFVERFRIESSFYFHMA